MSNKRTTKRKKPMDPAPWEVPPIDPEAWDLPIDPEAWDLPPWPDTDLPPWD